MTEGGPAAWRRGSEDMEKEMDSEMSKRGLQHTEMGAGLRGKQTFSSNSVFNSVNLGAGYNKISENRGDSSRLLFSAF